MLEPQSEGIPLPRGSAIAKPFWDGCAEHRLLYQRCVHCEAAVFNPAPLCPRCRARELAWHESAGVGSIYSWTIAHRPMTSAFTVPYAPIIVDLDEGYQMVSNLIEADTDSLAVGRRVQVVFREVGDRTLPYFRPVGEQ
jgi:uncharacterized OB-fold protein